MAEKAMIPWAYLKTGGDPEPCTGVPSSSFGPLEVEIFGPNNLRTGNLSGPGFKMPFPMLGTGGEEGRMGGWLVERRGQSTLN